MSEENLRALLRRAVPEPPELDAPTIARRAARSRRNHVAVAAGGAAVLAIVAGSMAIATLVPDVAGHVPPTSPAATVVPWAPLTPGPHPVPPGSVAPLAGQPIDLALIVTQRAQRGQPLTFIVRITNSGSDPVSLKPCPYYRVQYLPQVEGGYLNCAQAPDAIPPHAHLDFAMQINVPPLADAPDLGGRYDLLWQLGGEGAEGQTVTTPVELAPSANLPATPTCHFPRKVSPIGAGFVVQLNIFSGNPNPAWRLSEAQGTDLRRLLRATLRGIDRDGPDELGSGFEVRADRDRSISFLRGLDLPDRFWVQGGTKVARFLHGTLPCARAAR